MTVDVWLLNGVKERFCAGIAEDQSLGARISTVSTYIGSESNEVPHCITSVQRRHVGSTHGGESICLACRSWRA